MPLRAKSKIQILRCYKILEISIEVLDKDKLRKQYYKISRKYHPDLCIEEYKDGSMFAKMKASYDFLRNNMKIINENIEALREFKENAGLNPKEEEVKENDLEEEKEIEEKPGREEHILKSKQIVIKQTNNFKTIKNCLKIEKALEELEFYDYEYLKTFKDKLEKVYNNYDPNKLLKKTYFVYMLLIVLSVIIGIIAVPTTNIVLVCIAILCLITGLVLVYFCGRYKRNIVFYTELTGKTLSEKDLG